MTQPPNTGSLVYQVHFELTRARRVVAGRLGILRFAPGWYFYTGSARRGAAGRIRRHFLRRKKRHWHIDHLLSGPAFGIAFVLILPSGFAGGECGLHKRTFERLAATMPAPGFGATDCREGCGSHLARLSRPVLPADLMATLEVPVSAKPLIVDSPKDLAQSVFL